MTQISKFLNLQQLAPGTHFKGILMLGGSNCNILRVRPLYLLSPSIIVTRYLLNFSYIMQMYALSYILFSTCLHMYIAAVIFAYYNFLTTLCMGKIVFITFKHGIHSSR